MSPSLAEAVTVYPDATSTAARFALRGANLGYDGLIVRNAGSIPAAPTLSTVSAQFDVDLIHGVEVHPTSPEAVSGRLPHLQSQSTVVLVSGGTADLNRFIASQHHVDVLVDPIGPDGPDIDAGLAKEAGANDVAIEVNLGPLRDGGGDRVRYIDRVRRLWRVIAHYDVPYVVSMSPQSHLELRHPRDLTSLGEQLDIEADAIMAGLETWQAIAERGDGTTD